MLITFINSSRGWPLVLISWLREHLIPCPFKYLTGLDCPGCGFQRSLLALMQGNFIDSFKLYPPTIPLLLLFIYGIADRFFKLDNQRDHVKKSLFMLAGTIVLVSYGFKLWHIYHYAHSSVPAAAAI